MSLNLYKSNTRNIIHDENDFVKKHKIPFSTYFLKSERRNT